MTKSPDVPAPYPTYTSSDSDQVYPLPIISILRISNLEPSPPGVRILTHHAHCTPPLAIQIPGSLRTRTVAHPRYLEKQQFSSKRVLQASNPTPQKKMTDRMIIGTNKSPTNPTPLSAPQEQQVKDLYYKNVRAKCAKEIETFAQCALGRTFTMIYACRQPRLAMNSCMLQYQNQDELDKARLEWFALAEERRQVCYFNNEQTNILRKLEDGRVGAIS